MKSCVSLTMYDRVLAILEGLVAFAFIPLKYSCKILMRANHVTGYCPPEDKEKYHRVKDTIDKCVIVFNHPTYFDHVVMMYELDDIPRWVALKKYMAGPLKWVANQMKAIPVTPKSGFSEVLSKEINERKAGDAMIAISPAGGKVSPTDQFDIQKFRTGAFLTKPTVLPIVIVYDPYVPWLSGEPVPDAFRKRLTGPPVKYVMRVLDPVTATTEETPEEFASRCKAIMEDSMRKVDMKSTPSEKSHDAPSEYGSFEGTLTSHLILLCAIVALRNHFYVYGTCLFGFAVLSWVYYGTNDGLLKHLYKRMHILLLCISSIVLMIYGHVKPLLFFTVAAIMFVLKINHAAFVHIPLALGLHFVPK